MLTLSVQIKVNGKDWEDLVKTPIDFKNWEDASTFAYRLSLIHGKEIRLDNKGQGTYYHPTNAYTYFKM